jgi:hypothetical protein
MIDSPLVTLIGLGVIGVVFVLLFMAPYRRAKEESGQTLLYEERCTGRKKVGLGFSAGGNIPNWRISFYESFFVIASIGTAIISYKEVESVKYRRQFFSKGVHILVRSPRMEIVLFPKDPQKILALFEGKHVSVVRQ